MVKSIELPNWIKYSHLVSYKIAWYFLVGYQNSLWLILAAAMIAFQFWSDVQSKTLELRIFLLAILGFAIDFSMVQLGVLKNIQGGFPFWLILLWLQFVLLLPLFRLWIPNRWVAALAGAIGGPFAYYGGQSLGAVEISTVSLITHGVIYGGMFFAYIASYEENSK